MAQQIEQNKDFPNDDERKAKHKHEFETWMENELMERNEKENENEPKKNKIIAVSQEKMYKIFNYLKNSIDKKDCDPNFKFQVKVRLT
jgi:hypothetical protein